MSLTTCARSNGVHPQTGSQHIEATLLGLGRKLVVVDGAEAEDDQT